MKYFFVFLTFFSAKIFAQELTLKQANHLATLPSKCNFQEYPNKLGQVLIGEEELQSPKSLHPTFYGCFDWHSSVHGHWSLVYLLKTFPELKGKAEIIKMLDENLSKENIEQEITYLSKEHEYSYERTYGWSWLLKLQLELDTYETDFAQKWAENLRPLSLLIVERYKVYLPKLLYPIRVGTHTNTSFGFIHALEYARHSGNTDFQKIIEENAYRLFASDKKYPWQWEPNGNDFLSPTLEEINLMRRVMSYQDFNQWLKKFAPDFYKRKFQWDYAKVSDRTDGHLVHLDGLNFSRAWNLYDLIAFDPKKFKHLKPLADGHLSYALPTVVDGNYEGEHWLASFALKAFQKKEQAEKSLSRIKK